MTSENNNKSSRSSGIINKIKNRDNNKNDHNNNKNDNDDGNNNNNNNSPGQRPIGVLDPLHRVCLECSTVISLRAATQGPRRGSRWVAVAPTSPQSVSEPFRPAICDGFFRRIHDRPLK